MSRLVSIDLYADFGCLKKPDTNDPVYLTFNMLHKPALLGILGAITGLEGFTESPPKLKKKSSEQIARRTVAPYYEIFKDLKIGISPLRHENGNFSKTVLTYNNGVGYANVQNKIATNLMVTEQMLISPGYRCFILFEKEDEIHKKLFENLKNYNAEYLPYLGKNEFSVWWENWQEYNFTEFEPVEQTFEIKSVFIKEEPVREGRARQPYKVEGLPSFMYFENLPIGYDESLMQYEYAAFAFTNSKMKREYKAGELLQITNESNAIIQIF